MTTTEGGLAARGSFNNYVDQILSKKDPLSPSSGQLWTFFKNIYPLFTWQSMDFLLTTYPPLLVNVVIERPPRHTTQMVLVAPTVNDKSLKICLMDLNEFLGLVGQGAKVKQWITFQRSFFRITWLIFQEGPYLSNTPQLGSFDLMNDKKKLIL